MAVDRVIGKQKTWVLGQSVIHTFLGLERAVTWRSIEREGLAMKPILTVRERTVRASQARVGFCQLETELRWTPGLGSTSLGAPQIRISYTKSRSSNALGFSPSATLMM